MLRLGPLAFLRNPKDRPSVIRVSSETKNIRKVSTRILSSIAPLRPDEGKVFDIKLCIEEAVRNAIVHGNRSDRRLSVTVTYGVTDDTLTISVQDEGSGYDHTEVADPTASGHILKNSGRGVYLIKKLMDTVEYNETGNRITMVKKLK